MAYHGAISVQFALTVHATMTVTMETALKCLNVIHEYLCIHRIFLCICHMCSCIGVVYYALLYLCMEKAP